jgi:hypothetical protein
MAPKVRCCCCGKDMEFEVRIPSLSVPGQIHYFFSCECGRVTSQAQTEDGTSRANENEKVVDQYFVTWATRSLPHAA